MSTGGTDLDIDSAKRWPVGVWLSLVANFIGLSAGAVFLLAARGDRFRGSESVAMTFVCLLMLAVPLGLFAGLPLSVYDCFRRRKWLWGSVGVLLAFTPLPLALLISNLIAELRGLIFD